MSIRDRISRLEVASLGGAERCPECGLSARDPEAKRIVTTYEDDESALEEALAKCCEECGRPEVIHIRIVCDRQEGEGGIAIG